MSDSYTSQPEDGPISEFSTVNETSLGLPWVRMFPTTRELRTMTSRAAIVRFSVYRQPSITVRGSEIVADVPHSLSWVPGGMPADPSPAPGGLGKHPSTARHVVGV